MIAYCEVFMFPVIKDYRIKEKCQIFTPEKQVEKMLDLASYKNNLYGKKFLENSCGNGEILIRAVKRYIDDCKKKRYSKNKIRIGLEQDFTAYEVDEQRIEECKNRLKEVLTKYKIENVDWNIINKDYLAEKSEMSFDYIVGNPPYIAYPDLPSNIQESVKEKYKSCKKGKFDYSYAFIEKSYSELNYNGSLVYIIPSNIFKNAFADKLRSIIKKDIVSIDDYPSEKVFEKVLVSPAIICVVKGSSTPRLVYRSTNSEKEINKNSLGDKWSFESIDHKKGKRIGDFFKVSSAIATLLNEAFIIKNGALKNDYYELGNNRIEVSLIKRAASPKNKKYNKTEEYIIFPYSYDKDGKLCRYSEEQMYALFPCAMRYLKNYKEKLDERDSDKSAKWFEYGRSQALQNINQKKILISSVISNCTEPYMLDVDEVPYSGLYIVPTSDLKLENLLNVLRSTEFKMYISNIGVCVSGTSKRISPKDIENFVF